MIMTPSYPAATALLLPVLARLYTTLFISQGITVSTLVPNGNIATMTQLPA